MKKKSSKVEEALMILHKGGQGSTAAEMFELSMELKKELAFGYARRILTLARKDLFLKYDMSLELDQQCALCTYKDVDLPLADRLEQALHILREGRPDLTNSKNQETLGIAGAIYKRKWESDGQKQHLESALAYYIRGYEQGPENDNGYTGINAAFILDLLAQQEGSEETKAGGSPQNASIQLKEADWIRNHIVETLTALYNKPGNELIRNDWWLLVTVAEALFGLQDYEAARPWLKKAITLKNVPDWQLEVTTRQLAKVASLQQPVNAVQLQNSPAWQVLKEFINDSENETAALETAFTGKVGLALSGGGFRASLYHIGVLAKLAEFDMLRRVEVLSCVSGGSIIGAHYYLAVRQLLQTKSDKEIIRQDYIDLIDKIGKDFLDGVQRNIRTRAAANYWSNLKMMWLAHYSRTDRAGELFERELFSKVTDGEEDEKRWLNHLFIHPINQNGQKNIRFNPKQDNWRRNSKVPILILNATTLNTGHNWQFTASWMGESPASVQPVDGNYRLRRMYYKEDGDPKFRRTVRLGHAVAASCCIPGIFEPLAFPHLFDNKVVRLIDGGVYDNQGICGLLEQDCNVLLVSNASGQMGSEDHSSRNMFSVPLRANDILMERVRNLQLQDMNIRLKAGLLKSLMFIHLKMGLDVQPVDWINCEDPTGEDPLYKPQAKLTAYNIRKDIQKYLAGVRTDLDSFNDTEAFALMTSGYLMANLAFKQNVKGFTLPEPIEEPGWFFLEIEDDLKRPDASGLLMNLLAVAKERLFKIWRLSATLKFFAIGVIIFLVTRSVFSIVAWYNEPAVVDEDLAVTFSQIFWNASLILLCIFLIHLSRYWHVLKRFAIGIFMITFGWLAVNLHLLIFDKLYLVKGSRKYKAENSDKENKPVLQQEPAIKEEMFANNVQSST